MGSEVGSLGSRVWNFGFGGGGGGGSGSGMRFR